MQLAAAAMRPNSRLLLIGGLLAATTVLGWLDYQTGPNIAFSLFYLIPVVIAGWFGGTRAAIVLALFASAAWFLADYAWQQTTLPVGLWNTFTRLAIFIAIGTLTAYLRLKQLTLERANEHLESFTRSASHDLRSPLIQIGRYSELLRERVSAIDEEAARHLTTIGRAATDGLKLIDDLLRFAQTYDAEIVPASVDLNLLIANVRAELSADLGRREVRWHVDHLPPVTGDAALLQVALRNLLDNALKYTAPRDEAIIEVTAFEEKDSVVVAIRDNGVGFDPKYTNKLFQVFERLHGESEFEGTGIGLAIVREVIVRHGGRVWAQAQPDAGATFYFSLRRSG